MDNIWIECPRNRGRVTVSQMSFGPLDPAMSEVGISHKQVRELGSVQLYWLDLNYKYKKALQFTGKSPCVCLCPTVFPPPSKELSTTSCLIKV